MKLQIEGQHLRVRVGEEELAALLAGQPVLAQTRLAAALALSCQLRLVDGGQAHVGGTPEAWAIELPAAAVRAHAATLPSRDGLSFLLEHGQGEPLMLLFDVDVRDSTRRRRAT